MSDLSAKRQTLCKEGTQSHGTHAVSRATEREALIMDQRGSAAEPFEARANPLPDARVASWAATARRLQVVATLPAQRDRMAA